MAEVTVRQLAQQVGIAVDRLLLQLGEAGLPHSDADESVNEQDRKRLLNHLRRMQGRASTAGNEVPKNAALKRKAESESNVLGERAAREAVTIEMRKRRAVRTPTDTPATAIIAAEPVVAVETPPVVASNSELEIAKRALLDEAKQRSDVLDASIRADTEAREKAELLKPKVSSKPKRQTKEMGPESVAQRPPESPPEVSSEAPAQVSLESPAQASLESPTQSTVETCDEVVAQAGADQVTADETAPVLARAKVASVAATAKSADTRKAHHRRAHRPTRAKPARGERGVVSSGADREELQVASDNRGRRLKEPSKSPNVVAGASARHGFHWWARTKRASAALRPGILTGVYPEREDMHDSWLERTAASAAGLLRQHVGGGRPRYQYFVDQVAAAAQGMDDLDDAALARLVPELRRRLYSEGFSDELVSRSFAMVRELATRRLGMRHYDVQLYGGWIMLNGMIAEMETGEGKTLTATLTAATVALAGIPVHVVTVNDFLVQRDAAWMQPLYKALGLKVGTITEDMKPDERRKAYACDITYCTNKQLVFDYLKDRLILGADSRRLHLQLETLHSEIPRTRRLLLRGLCFAIVDEADSVLVDEARTPLVISKSGDMAQHDKTYRDAIRVARQLRGGRDFETHTRDRRVDLTEAGKKRAALLTRELKGVWTGVRRRESLMRQALSAIHLFQLDKHYLINDGKAQIVDEYTGRVMADRSWEGGLHQMIQAKESVEITGQQETLARISYQRFFRRYLRVAGMTGTAHEVARELWSVYRLNVVRVPTNRPAHRSRLGNSVHSDAEHKWQAVVRDIRAQHECRRPVLVGTRSVGASEHLSELLHAAGLDHVVLNARQDQHEAEVIAMAGQAGRITVATNMAGRGTDIRLAPGVADNGGLHVLATERHESGRIDRQLFGRGARRGDPGSYRCLVSLDDELIIDFWPQSVLRMARALSVGARVPRWLGAGLVALAQRAAENNHGRTRRDLLRLDDNLGDMLAFSGRGE